MRDCKKRRLHKTITEPCAKKEVENTPWQPAEIQEDKDNIFAFQISIRVNTDWAFSEVVEKSGIKIITQGGRKGKINQKMWHNQKNAKCYHKHNLKYVHNHNAWLNSQKAVRQSFLDYRKYSTVYSLQDIH